MSAANKGILSTARNEEGSEILTRSRNKLKVSFHIGLGLFYGYTSSGEHGGILGVPLGTFQK